MNTHLKRLLILFLVLGLCAIATADLIKLTWDMNDPGQRVMGYNVYEKSGTNWTRVGSTTNTFYIMDVVPGAHIYAVTATNFWKESPFSVPVETPAVGTSPSGVSISRSN